MIHDVNGTGDGAAVTVHGGEYNRMDLFDDIL